MARSGEDILKDIIGTFVIQLAVAQAAKQLAEEHAITLQRRVEELSATPDSPITSC